jgi:hypothetical protein
MYRSPLHRSSRFGRPARVTAAVAVAVAIAFAGPLPARAGPAAATDAATPGDTSPPHLRDIRFSRSPALRVIPDAAMLQPADLRGATPEPFTDDHWSALLPPQPCAGTTYPSAALRRAGRSVSAMVGMNELPTVVLEHVAVYKSDGAHRYLRELRRGLAACDGPDQQGARWTTLATGVAGDESLLLRRRVYLDYAGTYHNSYLVVARVGRVLVVVADIGWETAGGHRALVRELGAKAVRRAAVLNHR